MVVQYIFGGLVTIIGGVVFKEGFKRHKHIKLIQETPRSKIRSMAMGLVEIHGNATAESYLKTPFSQTDCVYYRYDIKEYKERVVTTAKSARVERRWETIAQGTRTIHFKAQDDTGTVIVDPQGAEFNVEPKKVYLQKAGIFGAFNMIAGALKNWDDGNLSMVDVMKWNLTPLDPKKHRSFINHVGDRKYFEYYITPQDSLFIMGSCEHDKASNPIIKKGDMNKTFIISDKSEKDLLKKLKKNMWMLWFTGIVAITFGLWVMIMTSGII